MKKEFKFFILIFLTLFLLFHISFYERNVKANEKGWIKITYELYGGYINFFTPDPNDSKVLYVSTNNGIFKSEDQGKIWKNLGLTEYNINSIEIDSKNTKIIYVSTEGDGILKSIDGGLSWKKINDGIEDLNVKFVRIDKNNNSIIYSITWSGIYKSTNQGLTWFKINNGITNFRINSFLINPKNSNILYIATWSGIFKSIDGGENWFSINNGLTDLIVYSLTIDYNNTDILYCGTDSGLFKSIDGGESWIQKSESLKLLYEVNIINDYSIYNILIDPNNSNVLYLATSFSGVLKSTDSGENFFAINKDLDDLRVRLIYFDPINSKVLYAFSLGGGIYKYFNPCIIKIESNDGGKVNPSQDIEVEYGGSILLSFIPDEGYFVKEVIIDGKSFGFIKTYKFEDLENDHKIKVIFEKIKEKEKIILKLQIGNLIMLVNGIEKEIDVPPQIVEGRTLLPIRWVAETLGANVGWDGVEKKVTVSLKENLIELWIGKNIARVNGIDTPIDPNNPKVVPMIISGRTMLPVRFVAENLGCKVLWDGITKTVIITYEIN
ncbi:MAG: stalk domain-containing protein [Caldisericia bacterium]